MALTNNAMTSYSIMLSFSPTKCVLWLLRKSKQVRGGHICPGLRKNKVANNYEFFFINLRSYLYPVIFSVSRNRNPGFNRRDINEAYRGPN